LDRAHDTRHDDGDTVGGLDYGAIYERRFPAEDPVRARWRRALWQVLVNEFFSRWIPQEGTVLDFGCGQGEFINAVRARRRIAVDARPGLERYLAAGVEFIRTRTFGSRGSPTEAWMSSSAPTCWSISRIGRPSRCCCASALGC
jgi:hypothetical protein